MKKTRKSIPHSVSFTVENYNFLQKLPKRTISTYINTSILEKRFRETTKEGRLIVLKEKKRELAKKMNNIDKKIMDLEE